MYIPESRLKKMNIPPRPQTEPTAEEFAALIRGDLTVEGLTWLKDARHKAPYVERDRAAYRAECEAEFAKLATLQLLNMRRNTAKQYDSWGFTPISGYDDIFDDALRAELARRPHIPNKQEAKARRQARAKARRGQRKGKSR